MRKTKSPCRTDYSEILTVENRLCGAEVFLVDEEMGVFVLALWVDDPTLALEIFTSIDFFQKVNLSLSPDPEDILYSEAWGWWETEFWMEESYVDDEVSCFILVAAIGATALTAGLSGFICTSSRVRFSKAGWDFFGGDGLPWGE